MAVTLAIGIGLVVAGLVFVATGGPTSGDASTKQSIITVLRTLAHVALAFLVAFVLASVNALVARVITLVLAAFGVGWAVLRATRSPTPVQKLIVLAATASLAMVVAAVLGVLLGGDPPVAASVVPTSSITDPAGDCECDPAFDIASVGIAEDGSVLIDVGGAIPDGGAFWLWLPDAPLVPIGITRTGDTWLVDSDVLAGIDAAGVIVSDTPNGLRLQLGYDIGDFAVTSAQGDRAPDTGYFGPDGTTSSTEIEVRYQRVYADLGVAHRTLARALAGVQMGTGTFTYDVGISADPGVVHSGTLVVEAGSVEFRVDASDTRAGHSVRYATDPELNECVDADLDPCVGMWVNPFLSFDALASNPGSVDVVALVDREVLGERAACVAVVDPGSSSLREGEFCSFADGTVAFVDDRTAGVVLVLAER
jgi:hypothetical protein